MFSWIGDHFWDFVLFAVAGVVAYKGYKWLLRRGEVKGPHVPTGSCNKCGWFGPLPGRRTRACRRCGSLSLTMRSA